MSQITNGLTSMQQILDSMELSVKLRNQARAERRAEEAEIAKRDFQRKTDARRQQQT